MRDIVVIPFFAAVKDCAGRVKEGAVFSFTTSFDVHHSYPTIGQYSQISDGFYRMYKGIGWKGTTSGIINADQTKRGRIKRKVDGEGKGGPDLQMW
jgi:hypothetical protein